MRRWQTFSLFALCFFQFCYRYLKIWHLLFVPHRTYTNRESDSLFLPFCTIGISMYQKSSLPYTLFLTYLPQAYSPLEHSWQTEKFVHPLFPSSFFSLSVRGPTRRRNFTGLAELRGGWAIEQEGVDYTALRWICIISFYGWSSYVISFGLRQYLDFVLYIIEQVPKYLGWWENTCFSQT